MDLLSQLNPNQAEAAAHFTGPALVIAGAGSGKTRTLVYRLAHLIMHHHVPPREILAVTFTNKAAAEMRERAEKLVYGASDLWMSTFHSAGVRILRAYGERIGLKRGFVILDDDDQLDLIKEIMGNIPGMPQDANPRYLRSIIDKAKSNLWTPDDLYLKGDEFMAGLKKDVAVEGYRRYESRMRGMNAIDFGDLLTETVRLFREVPDVLEKIQARARFIMIDEYQDTNTAQYEFARLLASKERNLLVVGDPDQCLPPGTQISTPEGLVPIENIKLGMQVLGTGGKLQEIARPVTHIKKGHYTGRLWSIQAGEYTLQGTPHHLVPARLNPKAGWFYVYLMYREDRGYRIGLTKSLRSNDMGFEDHGFKVRLNQEHGDKIWILRVCASHEEALYYEAWYAAHYGLPTQLFHGVGRGLKMGDLWLQKLFEELDTHKAALRLMQDLELHPEFPHHRPQNGVRRQSVNLVMYQDHRYGEVGMHRIQWCSNRTDIIEKLQTAGLKVRTNSKGKGGFRIEASRKSYAEALDLTKTIAQAGGMEIQRRAQIEGSMYTLMPLSHLHPGMTVLLDHQGQLVPAEITAVAQQDYDGPVYDLEVQDTHTYVASGMLVHNSIYKFRGADIKNILDFQQDYPDARVYKLQENYRSSAKVLTIANKLIENNTERLDKTLVPVKPEGEDVWFYRATDQKFESDFVAQQITLMSHRGYKLTDMAVLYRTNAQSRVVEESLRRSQIPAKIVGGVGFYDRREIKDILSYARLAINPSDDVAFRRIVGRPKRGIGDTAVQKLLDWGSLHRKSLLEAASMADTILERGANKCQEFALLMKDLHEKVEDYEPHHFLQLVIESTGYLEMLKNEGREGQDRRENLEELINAATDWSEQHEGGSIADFLDDAALLSSVDDEKVKRENGGVPEESITLMTLHNAKGLEFPVVFIVGVEEGLLPSRNSLMEPGGLEEERRLFYVGITRAMDRLYLTAAENRMQYGKTNSCEDSRFLEEIEGGFVPVDLYGQPAGAKKRGSWSSFHPSAPSVPKSTAPSAPTDGFKGGEKVKHPKFGQGVVLAVAGFGDKQQITVNFAGVGNKTLMTKFANLSRA